MWAIPLGWRGERLDELIAILKGPGYRMRHKGQDSNPAFDTFARIDGTSSTTKPEPRQIFGGGADLCIQR
jgi:hypothetical protein